VLWLLDWGGHVLLGRRVLDIVWVSLLGLILQLLMLLLLLLLLLEETLLLLETELFRVLRMLLCALRKRKGVRIHFARALFWSLL
jgi:hypothetical protein